jgi:hypothetical protein
MVEVLATINTKNSSFWAFPWPLKTREPTTYTLIYCSISEICIAEIEDIVELKSHVWDSRFRESSLFRRITCLI